MNKSFTLIEILVVIVVVGVLSAFILVGMSSITSSANIAKGKAFLNSMDNSLLLGRVSQWKFDELTTAKDTNTTIDSWGSNTGTLSTGDALEKLSTNCPSGKCLSLDGTNDYVGCGNGTSLNVSEITVGLWVKITTLNQWSPIISRGRGGGEKPWLLMLGFNSNLYSNVITTSGSSGNYWGFIPYTGQWYYLVFSYNSVDGMKTYVNGVSKDGAVPAGTINNSTTVNLYIGTDDNINTFFNGLIDDVRIYNQAIPTSQIRQNYFLGLNNLYKNNGITLNELNQRLVELKNGLVSKDF